MPDRRWLAAAGCLAVLTAGCATIPDHGPVHTGRALAQSAAAAGQVGPIPLRPFAGMAPAGAISGFLSAAATPSEQDVARLYLTPAAQARWHPGTALTVYDYRTARLVDDGGGRWEWRARRVATLGPASRWTQVGGRLSLHFRLARVGGQWRIAAPPNRQALPETELPQFYGRYDVAFVGAATGREVAVPAVVPLQPTGLASALVRALLAGPPRAISAAVTTAAPPATTLVGNATVTAGTATVDFTAAVRGFSHQRLQTFGQQLLATLGQLPGVQRVRVLADRAELLKVSDTTAFDPDPAGPARLVITKPSGAAWVRTLAATVPGRAPASTTWQPLLGSRWPAVTAAVLREDGNVVAVAPAGRVDRLLVGRPTGRPITVARAGQITPLHAAGSAVLVEIDGRRLALATGRRLHPLTGLLRATRDGLQSAALAPDGVQLAAVVGPPGASRLLVGVVRPDGRVTGLRQLSGVGSAGSVAWTGPSQLAVTAHYGRHLGLVSLDTEGFSIKRSALPGHGSTAALCAAPGADPVAVTLGAAWELVHGRWIRLGSATGCAYAG